MNGDHDLERQLAVAQVTIRDLQQELAETNRGLLALTLELEQRVDERTAELRAAHEELEKTNEELLQMTLELEERVAERTAQLQEATERIQLQIDRMPLGCIVWDTEFRVQTWNPAAEKIFGFSKQEVAGQHPYHFIVPAESQPQVGLIWQWLLKGVQTANSINENVTKDGRTITCEWHNTPLRRVDGTIIGVLSMVQDITERVKAEQALRARNEEIAAMSQQLLQAAKLATMGELAASIAHELNNPLATVSLRVESLLAQMPESDPKRRSLEVIEQEVERMGELIANLLQFSRRGAPQISSVDVREEIERSAELIHHRLRNHGITLVREFQPDVPLIHADRQQLRQVFLNLFNNSIDAMHTHRGGTLTVRVTVREPASEPGTGTAEAEIGIPHIVVEISDTGEGIPSELLPRIMEPFFTTKPEGKGTGLGLAICRRIVQEHKGTLDIFSQAGQGTTVRMTLPITNAMNGIHLRESL